MEQRLRLRGTKQALAGARGCRDGSRDARTARGVGRSRSFRRHALAEQAQVAVLGASGYTGAEITRLLALHPNINVRAITSERSAGQPFRNIFPHLRESFFKSDHVSQLCRLTWGPRVFRRFVLRRVLTDFVLHPSPAFSTRATPRPRDSPTAPTA